MAKRYEDMTLRERVAVNRVRARHRTPEARAEAARVRAAVMAEIPPAKLGPEPARVLAALKAERERQGLSLADVAERSGFDRAFISRLENGRIPNPTVATVARYAAALKKRVAMAVEDAEPVGN